ncbi:MAG: sigma-54 dependent transcriptional regulator [bacterium]
MSDKVLIVDDDHLMAKSISRCLESEGYLCFRVHSGEEALAKLKEESFNLVLLDLSLPGLDGFQTMEAIKADDPSLQVIILTASQNINDAIKAMKQGADDYLIKSSDMADAVRVAVQKAAKVYNLARENLLLKKQFQQKLSQYQLISESPCMKQVYQLTEKIAKKEYSTVLIMGESGTGKELVARVIHHLGPNSEKALVDVSCSALPSTLIESELFGFERGAFTDAKSPKQGLLELADGGTLFLDEIATLDHLVQAKLLRFLEQRTFRRIGGTVDRQVTLRVIAATNRDLRKKIITNEFREDLYYRLNVFLITIPPLRERREDIIPLANFFIKRFNDDFHYNIRGLHERAAQLLLRYTYPGNVRELKNMIERAMIIEESDLITPASIHLPPGEVFFAEPITTTAQTAKSAGLSPEKGHGNQADFPTLAEMEKIHISEALRQSGGNKELAAKLLGIGRSTLFRKLAARDDQGRLLRRLESHESGG